MSALIAAALSYAERGWSVFPCSPRNRAPLLPCDRDPSGQDIRGTGGVKKATRDPGLILSWWRRWPDAMIAAATGEPMGAFVVDVDVKKEDGRAALAVAEDERGRLPETWEAQTPSGGLHLYFVMPEREMRNRVGFLPGCDVRTTGGSITLPPSARDGKHYNWNRAPGEVALAEAPGWLIDLIAPPEAPRRAYRPSFDISSAYARAALNAESAEVASMKAGSGRNQRLFQAAARLGELIASQALDRATVETALEEAARACGLHMDDGGVRGIHATIASGISRGSANPRQVKSDVSPAMRQHLRRSQRGNQ